MSDSLCTRCHSEGAVYVNLGLCNSYNRILGCCYHHLLDQETKEREGE